MAPDNPDDDPKVKALLDPATQADLARWFSLPSFQQVAEEPKPEPVVDEEVQALLARRAKALEAIDPALVAAVLHRVEERPATLLKFEATIDVLVDEKFGMLDAALIDRASSIAEPRDVEIAEEIRDDLKECTPQALLRDLHRAEFEFEKMFERVDFAAEQRLDGVAAVASAMATRWKLPEPGDSPIAEGVALMAELRAQRHEPLTEHLPSFRNRRVSE